MHGTRIKTGVSKSNVVTDIASFDTLQAENTIIKHNEETKERNEGNGRNGGGQ